jgi:hypothetical protein
MPYKGDCFRRPPNSLRERTASLAQVTDVTIVEMADLFQATRVACPSEGCSLHDVQLLWGIAHGRGT